MRRLHWLTTALVTCLAVVVLGPASTALADSASPVPYTDPNSTGLLTLCDQSGNVITSGSTTATPFAWRVVSSEPAQPPYNSLGRTATLYAYQPREQVWASEWSGFQLTASAKYSNSDHPMAAFTDRDDPLALFLDQFPPQWDGLVQLRLYLGAPQQPPYTQTYASADLRVSGDTWTVLRGGTEGCDSGTSVSLERLLPKPSPAHSTGESAANGSNASGHDSPSPSATDDSAPASAAADASTASSSGGGLSVASIAFVVIGLALIIGAGVWYARGRGSDT